MSKTKSPVQLVRAGQSAELYIFGDLVSERWYEDETSPNSLRKQLEQLLKDGVTELDLHIDSMGGDVSAGWAIYNLLKDWRGTVNSFADGFVASAAVYPFLAGKTRAASPVSAFFLHKAWMLAAGNADELRKQADDLEKINDIGLEAFAAAGMDREKIRELEDRETWLSAQEALELGLATEILDRSEETGTQQSVRAMIVQTLTAAGDMTANERRARLGLEPIREDGGAHCAPLQGQEGGGTPRQSREKPAGEAGAKERETNPGAGDGAGEVKSNHLMAFLTQKAN